MDAIFLGEKLLKTVTDVSFRWDMKKDVDFAEDIRPDRFDIHSP